MLPKPSDYWKTEYHHGSDDCSERSWIRHESPGFTQSLAIHYCTQSVWAITLDLIMVSSVFWSLISFLEAPWWYLVCYVQATATTTRGLFVTYFLYTFIITMVSYQYFSYLYYLEIHLLRYICCYCPLTYGNSVIFIMFNFTLSHNFSFFTNILFVHFWYFRTQLSCSRQRNPKVSIFNHQQQVQKLGYDYPNKATTKRQSTIRES